MHVLNCLMGFGNGNFRSVYLIFLILVVFTNFSQALPPPSSLISTNKASTHVEQFSNGTASLDILILEKSTNYNYQILGTPTGNQSTHLRLARDVSKKSYPRSHSTNSKSQLFPTRRDLYLSKPRTGHEAAQRKLLLGLRSQNPSVTFKSRTGSLSLLRTGSSNPFKSPTRRDHSTTVSKTGSSKSKTSTRRLLNARFSASKTFRRRSFISKTSTGNGGSETFRTRSRDVLSKTKGSLPILKKSPGVVSAQLKKDSSNLSKKKSTKKIKRCKRGVVNSVPNGVNRCSINRDTDAEKDFQKDPLAFMSNNPVSTRHTEEIARATKVAMVNGQNYNFGLSANKYDPNAGTGTEPKSYSLYPLKKNENGGIPAKWMTTKDGVKVDPQKDPGMVLTGELQSCTLYGGCSKSGKLKLFHHYTYSSPIEVQKDPANIQKIKEGGQKIYKVTHPNGKVKEYTDRFKYKEYGMPEHYTASAYAQLSEKGKNPNFVITNPVVYATPVVHKNQNGEWNFVHGKIGYPNVNQLKVTEGAVAAGGGQRPINLSGQAD